jgi:hypothetical protein
MLTFTQLDGRAAGRRLVLGLVVVLAAGFVVALTPLSAQAGDEVECPPIAGSCSVVVTTPGTPGGGTPGTPGGGGSGTRECRWAGVTVPCSIDMPDEGGGNGAGWFNATDGCYYFHVSPQPPTGDPIRAGHPLGDGAVYETVCYPKDSIDPLGLGGVGIQWLAAPPPGFGGGVNPAQLAAQAINQLPIRGPKITTAPRQGASGLVGLPVWLWTPSEAETWGPASASASAGGITVTATARASKITWDMGDGTTVTCTTPGTPYTAAKGGAASPDCGHVYRTSSKGRPGGAFTVTATTTWTVNWAGGGQTGTVTVTRQSAATVGVGELVVVNS